MKQNSDQIFDELLVIGFRDGDPRALNLLVKRWHDRLRRQIIRHTHDPVSSDDIAQDCWEIIVRRLGRLRDPAAFGPWAMRIASNQAVNWIRQNQRDRQIEFVDDSSDRNQEDRLSLVRGGIKKLPGEQRLVLSLFYLEGYSLADISIILNIPLGTVKSRLFHARENLKNHIK